MAPPRQPVQPKPSSCRDVNDFPYHIFEEATTHPALSIPVVRTAELRKSLHPLLALRSPPPPLPSPSRDEASNNTVSAPAKGGRRASQPYIIRQQDIIKQQDEKEVQNRSRERRLLVLRVDYDKDECDDGIDAPSRSNDRPIREARKLLTRLMEASANRKEEEDGDAIYLTTYDVRKDYNSVSAAHALRRLLAHVTHEAAKRSGRSDDGDGNDTDSGGGGDVEVPTRFEAAGHVAHVNLRDEWLPYKYWVGKVLLDKNAPAIRTVVNKVGSIENVYRVLDCEVIAGNADPGWSLVTVKEEGCVFDLDFQKVYWNSRLAGEHHRLVKMLQQRAAETNASDSGPFVVADLMAGVGPFAVPLTRRLQTGTASRKKQDGARLDAPNIVVHANDLNPDSYRFLVRNAQTNRCQNLYCYNQDARAFVGGVVEPLAPHAVIMNLPASAPEFLDVFRGFGASLGELNRLPLMYVYCFAPKEEEMQGYPSAVERCRSALTCDLPGVTVRTVRNVSPRNNMVCVQFSLPEQVRALPKVLAPVEDSHALKPIPEQSEVLGATEPTPKRAKNG